MKCQNFERFWNEQLDARGESCPDRERALDDHARGCAVCLPIHVRYRTLREAVASLAPAPAVPDESTRRLVAALAESGTAPRSLPFRRHLRPLALAASVLVAALVGGRLYAPIAERLAPVPVDPQPLSTLLADATAATLKFAKAEAAPESVADEPVEVADAAAPETDDAVSRALRTVGDRLHEGVEPLSGSARQAFGFLLGPALDDHGI